MALIRQLTNSFLPIRNGEKRPSIEASEILFSGAYGKNESLAKAWDELDDPMIQQRVDRVERTARIIGATCGGLLVGVLTFVASGMVLGIDENDSEVPACEDMALDGAALTPIVSQEGLEGRTTCFINGQEYRLD
jgi:hypothetical protein